jgi:hypothetical protein
MNTGLLLLGAVVACPFGFLVYVALQGCIYACKTRTSCYLVAVLIAIAEYQLNGKVLLFAATCLSIHSAIAWFNGARPVVAWTSASVCKKCAKVKLTSGAKHCPRCGALILHHSRFDHIWATVLFIVWGWGFVRIEDHAKVEILKPKAS